MRTRRLRFLSSAVLVLGLIGLAAPRDAAAATLVCGPVCVHTCIEGPTACEPCSFTGSCSFDPNCFPSGDGIQADCV
jgi:hypothetical protein